VEREQKKNFLVVKNKKYYRLLPFTMANNGTFQKTCFKKASLLQRYMLFLASG